MVHILVVMIAKRFHASMKGRLGERGVRRERVNANTIEQRELDAVNPTSSPDLSTVLNPPACTFFIMFNAEPPLVVFPCLDSCMQNQVSKNPRGESDFPP